MKPISRIIALAAAVLTAMSLIVLPSSADFTDVPESHWAYRYIIRAADAGAVSGMGDGSFDPDGTVTQAQFISIAVRGCGISPDETDGEWYEGYISAAERAGMIDPEAVSPDEPMTRYMMAQVVYSAMIYLGAERISEEDIAEAIENIPDEIPEDMREAVAGVYIPGVITGMDAKGTFAGDGYMTRAQSAVVFCRMRTVVETTVDIGGKSCFLGMSAGELSARFGEPKEILTGVTGLEWHVYDGFEPFFAAGLEDGHVTALCAAGKGFSYLGAVAGDMPPRVYSLYTQTFEDKNDGGIMHGLYMAARYYKPEDVVFGENTLYCEARLNYGLVNAFRVMHGLNPLLWSDAAAAAGRLHCEDMAANGYFAHESLDGRTAAKRAEAQGISYLAVGENIYMNTVAPAGGIAGYYHLVNSEGHREVMLYPDFEYLGVGCASDADGGIYLAEEFYKAKPD